MSDLRASPDAARSIATAALGRDPGPMEGAPSDSHHVYVGSDIVVKLIDADRHSRLEREIALATHLPHGLTPPLLASGLYRLDSRAVRYACYARAVGRSPGMGMPGVDATTARLLSEQAVQHLEALHRWTPVEPVFEILNQRLDHGGFVTQAELAARLEHLAALNHEGVIPSPLLDGLRRVAESAPSFALVGVPVHADCHWGNWLVRDTSVTALLDFEWARLGEPLDDWFFLARFSGPHVDAVLDVIARETSTSTDVLRAGCEVREAAHLANDLCIALEHPGTHQRMATERFRALEQLVVEHYWWRGAK